MQEEKLHKAEYQQLPITHCVEHQSELITECPGCKTPFEWDSSLLGTGCEECGESWASMAASQSASLPKLLT